MLRALRSATLIRSTVLSMAAGYECRVFNDYGFPGCDDESRLLRWALVIDQPPRPTKPHDEPARWKCRWTLSIEARSVPSGSATDAI
jgi:hypothetical protein